MKIFNKVGGQTFKCLDFWDAKTKGVEILMNTDKRCRIGKNGKSRKRQLSKRKRQWVKLLEAGGDKLKCPISGKEVYYISYDARVREDGSASSFHYNFYSKDGDFFTVDHIIPKSKGGNEMDISNLQAMLGEYNWKKSSNSQDQFKENELKKLKEKKVYFEDELSKINQKIKEIKN